MSEEQLTTQETIPESATAPENAVGQSNATELPEEYKPYSMIPWDSIPEGQREAVLQGVKKFHGGMTKGQQEAARLKTQVVELQRKSDLLDQLVAESWVKEAWERHQNGQSAPKEPEKKVNLSEHLDAGAAEAINAVVENAINARLGPLSSRLDSMGQEQANERAKAELASLIKEAKDKDWPDPQDHINSMTSMIANGRAHNARDAYILATQDILPDVIQKKTRNSLMEELKGKAQKTVQPTLGTGNGMVHKTYSGRDAVLSALRDAANELGIG